MDNVYLVTGMLSDLMQGPGWGVPEAWSFLGKAHGMHGMHDREHECLVLLSVSRRAAQYAVLVSPLLPDFPSLP